MKKNNGTLLIDIFDNLNKDVFLSFNDKKKILKFKDLVKDYFINVNPEFLEGETESKIYDSEGKTIIANENIQSIVLTNFGENIVLSISFESKDKRREYICFNYLKESKVCKVDSKIEQEIKYLSSAVIRYSGLIHNNGNICFKIDRINSFEYDKTDTSLLTKSNEVIYDGEKSEPDITSYSELTRKINDAIEMVNIRKKINRKGGIKNV